jgi:hypothetical protein
MITISETLQNTLSNFICYLNAIYQEISTTDIQEQSNFMVNRILLFFSNRSNEIFIFS